MIILRFLGFLAKYIVKWLKCQKFNNSIIRAIELLRSRQIKRSRIQEDKLSRTLPIKKSSLSHRSARCMLVSIGTEFIIELEGYI